MTGWTTEELDRIERARELELTSARPDGALREPVTIWVVRHDADLYVRSWRGPTGRWYRAAHESGAARIRAGGVEKDVRLVVVDDEINDVVDAAYRQKYRDSSYLASMVRPEARATTLKLVPDPTAD